MDVAFFLLSLQKNSCHMKRLPLFLVIILGSILSHAQEVHMEFIPFHYTGYELPQFENKILQQRNGDLVANVMVSTPSGDNHIPPIIAGLTFYKMSPTTLQITDTLFLADTTPAWYLFAQDPRGEGNLRANIEPDGVGGTALRISHFPDDDLHINPEEDIVVRLCDTVAFDYIDSYMMDSQGDLILKYYTEWGNFNCVCHIARVGADGTLKHEAVLPESHNFIRTMDEFESMPKRYYQWTRGSEENLFFYVMDSIFQVENYYVINKMLRDTVYWIDDTSPIEVEKTFRFGSQNSSSTFVVPDGDDVFVAAPFSYDSAWYYDFHESGTSVARYDLRTMQRKALVDFNDLSGPDTDVRVMCFQKTSDGDFFLIYKESDLPMTAVKMNHNLNVVWKRYCYEPNQLKVNPNWSCYSGILKDESGMEKGVYITGYSERETEPKNGIFFFFLTDEGLDFVGEGGIEVRPYAFYPNPAQDQLRLHYSPDVKPAQIELYDLQGRLVRSQGSGLESLSLQGLAPGQYVMKVTMADGTTFSDKVVKE